MEHFRNKKIAEPTENEPTANLFSKLLLQTFGFQIAGNLLNFLPKKTLIEMPAKNEQLSAAQLSEISTIRNILMGQQMNEYESKFAEVEEEISKTREHFTNELNQLSASSDERFRKMETDMNERFDRLEKLLTDHVSRLDQKLLTISKSDKNDLGKMLSELSKKLMGE